MVTKQGAEQATNVIGASAIGLSPTSTYLEEAELRDIFSRTLNNSQSKAYKYLVASCFKQKLSAVDDIT